MSQFFNYAGKNLEALRSGPWKLYVRPPTRRGASNREPDRVPLLVDLSSDFDELENRAAQQPEIVTKLLQLAEQARAELGDGERIGSGQRPVGRVDRPVAQTVMKQ